VVTSVTSTSVGEIRVTFDEQVGAGGAENPANYTITQTPAAALPWMAPPVVTQVALGVLSATLQPNRRAVVLATDPMDPFGTYELSIQGVNDVAGNSMTAVNRSVENRIQSQHIFTIAGTGLAGLGDENIDPLKSEMWLPQDLTFSPGGLPYILDWNNHRIRVIENGKFRTVLGTGILGDAPPGVATQTGFNHPTNIAFGPDGHMYIAAWHNSKVCRLNLTTNWCEPVVAQAGRRAFGGDGGPALSADLDLPSSVVFDVAGNLYIADQANWRIRVVDASGTINTWAGTGVGGFCGDGGPANAACINGSRGQNAFPTNRITFDAQGNLYIADSVNNRVRKIDTGGVINTVAGNGSADFSGDGGDALAASLNFPTDVAVHPLSGELYIADTENHCVRRVDGAGVITTVAGIGETPGYLGDGGRPTEARLYAPYGVAFDAAGNLYISDTKNHRIRVVYN
jgi:sugar lactone lactonase YvrE